MALDPTGTLDEAYDRLRHTGPEFAGWLSNHGPMAAEAMVRAGHAKAVHHWVDQYTKRLEELPSPADPINDWRAALGAEQRIGDWIEYFTRELAERPWRVVLATWWPRLLPGIAAGATHGVIRVGHVVRVLLAEEPTTPRVTELAHGLGYWAARWQLVPGATEPAGTTGPRQTLPRVPRIAEQTGGIRERIARLADTDGWTSALAAFRAPVGPEDAHSLLTGLVDAATEYYRTRGHGNAVMQVHAATAPNAVLRTLPALPPDLWGRSLAAAWAASAAVTSVYAPADAAPADHLPAAAATGDETMARAIAHGNEHAIKFADTAVEVFARTGAATALVAAARATELIEPH